ncbi:MAG: hypothetical protein ACREM2_11875 [Vulcanimicrobiaceae bacterium]
MLEAALRLGAALVLEIAALVLWEADRRSPLELVRGAFAALRAQREIVRGLVRALVGLAFLAAALLLVLPVLTRPERELFPVIVGGSLLALGLSHLIGADLRRLLVR